MLRKEKRGTAGMNDKINQNESGETRVRRLLINGLLDTGMRRPKGQTVEDWDRSAQRICAALAHMDACNLVTLREHLLVMGTGPARDRMPSEVTIRGLAEGLQPRPVEQAAVVASWLSSVEGPPALAGGYAVELYRLLQRVKRPPTAYEMRKVREAGGQNGRRVQLIEERMGRDAAGAEDRAWLEAYRRDRQAVEALVRQGAARRAASGTGDAA
jgi:hypothetical protein